MSFAAPPGTIDLGPEARARIEAVEARILSALSARDYVRVEPPILELAEPFLETSGEDIRRRLYSFFDPAGIELCLRPDLTIPVCRHYLRDAALNSKSPARLLVSGPAFRHQNEGVKRLRQFRQIDAEILAMADGIAADAEILVMADAALRAGGVATATLTLGDLGLFFDLLNRLEVAPRLQAKLRRALGRPGAVEALLSNGAKPASYGALGSALGNLSPETARQMVEEILSLARIPTVGGRTVDEIASRFIARASDASASSLNVDTAAAIRDFLKIEGTPESVAKTLEARFKSIGLNLAPFRRRCELMAKAGLDLGAIRFACSFARPIDYYSGLVFEMTLPASREGGPVLAGGRYDGLLSKLGATRNIPAIGFALWPERLIAQAGPHVAQRAIGPTQKGRS